jgi:hypothetical protein
VLLLVRVVAVVAGRRARVVDREEILAAVAQVLLPAVTVVMAA